MKIQDDILFKNFQVNLLDIMYIYVCFMYIKLEKLERKK